MRSFREPTATALPPLSISLPVAVDLSLGIGTIPLVVWLASGRAIAASLIQLGTASEEVFRGEQLPTLPLMDAATDTV